MNKSNFLCMDQTKNEIKNCGSKNEDFDPNRLCLYNENQDRTCPCLYHQQYRRYRDRQYIHLRNDKFMHFGEFQTLFLKVKFSNFEKFCLSCD